MNKTVHVAIVVERFGRLGACGVVSSVMAGLRDQDVPVLEVRGIKDPAPDLQRFVDERNALTIENHRLRCRIEAAQRVLKRPPNRWPEGMDQCGDPYPESDPGEA